MERIKTHWIIITLIILSGIIWGINYNLHFNGFYWNDSHDYSQMARNIYEGNGFSTSVLRPISFLNFQTLPHPELTRPPVYPHLLAAFFWLFGPNDFAVVLLSGLFYILFVIFTFLFARELTGGDNAALFTSLCAALSAIFLSWSIGGSSDIVYSALLYFFFYVYTTYPEKVFLHGLIVGVLYLTRANTVFLIPALVLVDFNPFIKRTNWKRLAVFITSLILVVAPYLTRNLSFTGLVSSVNSSGLVMFTKSYPGYTYWTQLTAVPAWEFIKTHPGEFYVKIINALYALAADFKGSFGVVLLILMAVGLLVPLKEERQKRTRKIILSAIVIQTFVVVPISPEARYYMYFVPIILSFVFIAVGQISEKIFRMACCVLILSLVIVSSAGFWKTSKQFNFYQLLGDVVKAETEKKDIIASDIAWELSWYADRRTVWLPYDLEMMKKISESVPVNYVFLSIYLSRQLVPYKDNIWQQLFFNVNSFKLPELKLIKVFYFNNRPVGVLYKTEINQ
ncbi:MAG: glycosyltransferase family 39 protein [Thermodesulfovibrionales bacterium]